MSIELLVYAYFLCNTERIWEQKTVSMSLDDKRGSKFSSSLNRAIACIAAGISQAFYKEIPGEIISKARNLLSEEFLTIIDEFNRVSFA